jgi:N-acetylneuraminate synthase
MATKKEISEAIQTVRKYNNKKIILMKCTSAYPADPKYSNLKTITDMRKSFNCEIGLSDPTIGIGSAISSINHGASIIEKHFTISKKDGGIDSPFSLEPFELKMLVNESKRAWLSNGKVNYGPSKSEKKSLVFRRSIFLNKDFKKGEILKLKDISILRPKIGLEPKMSKKILGKKAQKNLKKNTPIKIGMFK